MINNNSKFASYGMNPLELVVVDIISILHLARIDCAHQSASEQPSWANEY